MQDQDQPPKDHRLITDLLERAFCTEDSDRDILFEAVYDELRLIAARAVAHQPAGSSVQVTNVVHEAYLKMAKGRHREWNDHRHFLRWAATIVRSVLIDRVRAKRTRKRGDGAQAVPLDDRIGSEDGPDLDVLALDEALTELASVDPKGARVIELRYFCGLSRAEVATVLEVDESTVKRRWRAARAWLASRMSGESAGEA